MDRLTRMLTGVVRSLAGLLGERRRDWADDVREPLSRLAFAAGAVGLVWIGWPGASTNSATPVNRLYVVGTLVLLAGLPRLVSRYVGPVRPGWAPRLARVVGYGVVLAFIAATAVKQRVGSQLGVYFPVILPVWVMDVGFLLIVAGYVAGLLVLTSRRVRFARWVLPTALGIAVATAGLLYASAPFGLGDIAETAAHSLHGGPVVVADYLVLAGFAVAALAVPVAVHAAVTRIADRDTRPGLLTPTRQALLATTGAMATAAILVALFTTLTIALLPHHITVPPRDASDGACPTCDPSTMAVPPNLRREYAFEDSVNGAGDGAAALLIVPFVGAALGALRGHLGVAPSVGPEGT